MENLLSKVAQAYVAARIQDQIDDFEADQYGHPFTICTKLALWVKEHYFPDAIVTGYSHDKNPSILSEWPLGHDFLVLHDKYVIDFWPRLVQRMPLPLIIDLKSELITKYYGDPCKWEKL